MKLHELKSRLNSIISSVKNYILGYCKETRQDEPDKASQDYFELCREGALLYRNQTNAALLSAIYKDSARHGIGLDPRGVRNGGLDNYIEALRDAGEKVVERLSEGKSLQDIAITKT